VIRVVIPRHLAALAGIDPEVRLEPACPVTPCSVLDALEKRHPVLRGTLRDGVTLKRRPLIRFFACGADLSHQPPDSPVPDDVVAGREPFLVVAAIAGG